MRNKIISGILSIIMIFCICTASVPAALASGNTITISSREDFEEFSKNCTLDTWSKGKTVNLTCNIDFTNCDFLPVPTFGGIFKGNGYTISGIKFSENGSYVGIFRYIQNGGKVSGLNVKATFTPNGSKSFVGGIAGENSGILSECNFEGTVKGQDVIGGIVGNNADSGQIISCTSSGNITGENSTGGIAGKNSGFIKSSANNAAINTVYEEKKNNISDFDADTGAIIENYKNNIEETEEDSVLGHSDTGGIVGYSTGIVQGCTNNADVGYQHIGYNVGGIAGRQSGYMLGCKNYGFVQGRKDVGGIVGQLEPYILLNVSESGLRNIRSELNNLSTMVNRFITDTDTLGTDAEKHLTDISEYSKNARDNAEILINQGTDFIDDNIGEINAQSAILSNTLDKLIPVFESLESGGANMGDALDEIKTALDEIDINTPDLSDEIDDIKSALDEISEAEENIDRAALKFEKALRALDNAIEFKSVSAVRKAINDLSDAINDIAKAKQKIRTSIEKIEHIISSKPESFEAVIANIKVISENISTIKNNIDTVISSLQTIEKSIDAIIINTEVDFSEFTTAAWNIGRAVEILEDVKLDIKDNLENLADAFENLYDETEDYINDVNEELKTAKENLSKGIESLSYAVDDITDSIEEVKNIVTDLSNEEPLEFVKLGEDFKSASEDLFNSLSNISGEIEELKNTVSDGKETMTNNLTSINNQFNLVLNLLIDEFENFENGTKGISDIILDVSDEDIKNTRQGKVSECHNFGAVEADRNIGGISGAMAIEYTKDPEDDIEKPNTLNFTYRTKAVLQGCVNDGKVVGKKDCTGGIVGLQEMGTVYECQNYADIESTNGNYVGGVAGKSESAIRKSYAKNKLTGKRYIGGIAGKADIVTACYTIVNVSGDENAGAICGNNDNSKLYQNFYVDNGVGAVDGISYAEKAMPIAFESLPALGGIPTRFISFTVTFTAGEKVVETKEIKYGDAVAGIKYPEIPKKEGYFGNWQTPEAEIVTENIEVVCEYTPYITILSSREKNENGNLAIALAEGKFTDKAVLHAFESELDAPVKAGDDAKVYDIILLNTDIKDEDSVTLRMLNANKDKVSAWALKNGAWEKVNTSDKGKYVILQVYGTENTLCLKYEKRNINVLLWIFIAAFVLIFIFGMYYKKRKFDKIPFLGKRINSKNHN